MSKRIEMKEVKVNPDLFKSMLYDPDQNQEASMDDYDLTEGGKIANPGPYEGEETWVPVAHDDSLNGCWDNITVAHYDSDDHDSESEAQDCECYEIETAGGYLILQAEDFETFGIPIPTYAVILWYSEQGFVSGVRYERKEDFESAAKECKVDGYMFEGFES